MLEAILRRLRFGALTPPSVVSIGEIGTRERGLDGEPRAADTTLLDVIESGDGFGERSFGGAFDNEERGALDEAALFRSDDG